MFAIPPFWNYILKLLKRWHNGQGIWKRSSYSIFLCCYLLAFGLNLYDTTNSKYVWCPPTIIAAKYVSVDGTYGSWYAPAGEA